ncbi:MAG: Glu/Leu/Phe/Val dehydrogenase dimerization domain-containing protein [Oligoflexales bacterium]
MIKATDLDMSGHEQVMFCHDEETGLKAIIAIHNTTLGPALGGSRFWDYAHQDEALFDVLRLSRGMTYKAAISGLSLGGGKSVLIGDAKKLKSESYFRAFGRFVHHLNGRYITAEDVNIKVDDMNTVALETPYVTGVSSRPSGSGDPSPVTAFGVFSGLKAAVQFYYGHQNLKGLHVAVQGCGAVGRNLCQLLHAEGAVLTVADLHAESTKKMVDEFGARVVSIDEIHRVECDVFAPCALGGGLNPETIPELQTPVVAGGANNQLLEEVRDGKALMEKGVLYAPDYAINAGGLINVSHELRGYNRDAAMADTAKIYDTMLNIFETAKSQNIPTAQAAGALAEQRIKKAKTVEGRLTQSWHNQSWIKVK